MIDGKLGVAVIGAGIGAFHVAAYNQLPRVKMHALAGVDDDRVREVAQKYSVPHTYHGFEEVFSLPEIDAVSICVPNHLHAPLTLEALRRGKHVLVEKPLARTPAEGREMIAAAEAAGKVLMVTLDKRYRGDVQWLKRHIDAGGLGRIYYAKAYWMRRAGIPRLGSWFTNKELAGGGPLIDLGVHVLDMALYLMGEPRPLTVSASTYAEFGPRGQGDRQNPATWVPGGTSGFDVEDLATAFIRLEGGATLLLEASWATHSSAGDDFGVTLYGTEGGAEFISRWYTHDNTLRIFTNKEGAQSEIAPNPPKKEGHLSVVENFVAAILDGAPPMPGAAEGLRRAEILDAAYRSAALGREIDLLTT